MATWQVTRFTVGIPAGMRELFAVRERVNGDIVITVDRSAGRADGSNHPAAQALRISAHVSADASGNTILYRIGWADGAHSSHAASVARRRGGLIWPVLTHAVADLSHDRYAAQISSSDTVVSLGDYDPRWTALTYSLVISTPGLDLSGLGQWNCVGRDFSHFRVSALWNFMRVPSFHEGGIVFSANAPTTVNGSAASRPRIKPRQSLSRAELASILRDSSVIAADDHVLRLRHFMQASGLELPEEIAEIARRFVKEPRQPDE